MAHKEEKHIIKKKGFLTKIKGMRGALYRKAIEKSGPHPHVNLPEFSIVKHGKIIQFPEMKDHTKVNITYPLIEPFSYANVRWNSSSKQLEYLVIEPQMNDEEKDILVKISDAVVEMVDVGLTSMRKTDDAVPYLHEQITKVLSDLGIEIDEAQYQKIMYYIYRDFVGFNEIEPLLQDPNIEDISCDGVETPIFVIHRKFGSIKTNVEFQTNEELREFIVKIAERAGRYVSYAEPILDGTLPNGSRVAATLAGDVATRGPTFTIRKFSERPFSPVEQVELGTLDSKVLAYFWYLIEHGASILVVGGVATGKTSILNTISMFIPQESKIVSIEDTREIRIPHEHWIAGLARTGFGVPTSSGRKYGEVTLFDLLRESFRQNPDYVIVGEVRGEETYVMFQGMSSGHPSLSTFHAGSVDSVIRRLTTPPINLAPSLIESLDVIAVMIHAREKGKSARRMKEVSEIVSIDPKTQEVKTNVIFRWDAVNDKFVKVNDSLKIEKLAVAIGTTAEEALKDIDDRQAVIKWMMDTGKTDYIEVAEYINMYLKEKDKLFQKMKSEPKILKKPARLSPDQIEEIAEHAGEIEEIERNVVVVGNGSLAEKMEMRRNALREILGKMKKIREK